MIVFTAKTFKQMMYNCFFGHAILTSCYFSSPSVCKDNIRLLFTVLEKSPLPVIRANTIVALGDLTVRFPNILEPWTPNLYAR